MLRARSLQFLFSLGLEFWLPLPFLGFGFWLLSGIMTGQVLNQLNPIEHTVSVTPQPETLFQENKISSIQLQINESEGITRVKVKIAAARLKELEFKFPGTDLTEVEAALSQELGLSEQEIKKLILTESNSTLHSQQIH